MSLRIRSPQGEPEIGHLFQYIFEVRTCYVVAWIENVENVEKHKILRTIERQKWVEYKCHELYEMQRQLDKLLVLIDNKGFDAKVDNLIIFFLEYEVDFDVDYIPPTSPQYSSSSSSESEADDDLNFEQIENDDIQPLKMYYTRTPLVLYHNPKFRGAIAIINTVITLVDSIKLHMGFWKSTR